tara:strand:+ start:15935 stop:16162 length:228 start_codon:yes stop_codon:yes gene_type:complete
MVASYDKENIMPVKFKPTQITRERGTGKLTTTHFYMKTMPKQELFDYINNDNSKPKIKQKCKNELIRRGIKIVYA